MTPDEPEPDKNVEFRTSFTIVVEGYDIDLDYRIFPALWKLILNTTSVSPFDLADAFTFSGTYDLRENPQNSIVDYRQKVTVMPPPDAAGS